MTDPQRYERHLDTVLALISNLALTEKEDKTRGRTVSGLTEELGGMTTSDEIQHALDKFPGLFRKTQSTLSSKKEPYYTLHLRWATAPEKIPNTQTLPPAPKLPPDILKALLEFVSKRAEAETAGSQFRESMELTQKQLKENRQTARLGAWLAGLAAILAAAATIIAALLKKG